MDKTKELLKKAFYRGNEVADMPSDDWDGLAYDWEKWYNDNVENILPLHVVSKSACDTKNCKFNKDNECIRMDLYNECIHKAVC